MLLRSWISWAGLAGQAAWVAAGRGERDPLRFWLSVLAALRQTAAGSVLVREVTAAPDLDGWVITERLLADLAPLDDRVWLVVDDVHELGTDALRQLELVIMRGVGSAAVQIAAAAGARVAAVASPPNHDYLLSLGTSEVFDYHAADWAQQVRAVVPGGVDLLFDAAGGQTRDQALGAVRDGGRAISIVLQGTPIPLERGITGESFAAHGGRPRLEQLAALVDAGKLRPQADTVLPLDQAREALARVATGHTRGKIVLQIG